MQPRTWLIALAVLSFLTASSQHVTIIESSVSALGETMDMRWHTVATNMGLDPQIAPQEMLSDISMLDSTDALIIASSTIGLVPNGSETIAQFVLSGRPAYIQAEYTVSYVGNITFDSVMSAVGVSWDWGPTVVGALEPVTITGELSTTPNDVDTLNYFWYGCSGSGPGIDAFLHSQGQDIGFIYPGGTYGTVITTSDQDWVIGFYSPDLMENILAMLLDMGATNLEEHTLTGVQVFPTCFTDHLSITTNSDIPYRLTLLDAGGRALLQRRFVRSLDVDVDALSAGAYFYELCSQEGHVTRGKLLKPE